MITESSGGVNVSYKLERNEMSKNGRCRRAEDCKTNISMALTPLRVLICTDRLMMRSSAVANNWVCIEVPPVSSD
jgi:hypothetical protein